MNILLDKFAANLELLTEEDTYNYAAYLLADENGNSVQVAKYAGTDRVDLVESKEYGFCCLVKTCKQVLDRIEGVENRTITKITSRERINRSLWNRVALREAIINAIIHNDYTTELVPKFEIFADRLEMTSAGHIHSGEEREDFFAGYSIPRNKTLMRVFKDLDMVEYLGSGMPRILKAYSRDAYIFSSRFIRTDFPIDPVSLMMEREEMAKTGGSIGGSIELTNRQTEILLMIKKDNMISYRTIAKTKGSSRRLTLLNFCFAILSRQYKIKDKGDRFIFLLNCNLLYFLLTTPS